MNAITELHGSGVRESEPLTRSGPGGPEPWRLKMPGMDLKPDTKFDLSCWEFGFGKLNKMIGDAVNEAIANTLETDPPFAQFAFDDDDNEANEAPEPDEIEVEFRQFDSCESGHNPILRTSITDLVDWFIECNASYTGEGPITDEESISKANRLSQKLRLLADKIDARIQ